MHPDKQMNNNEIIIHTIVRTTEKEHLKQTEKQTFDKETSMFTLLSFRSAGRVVNNITSGAEGAHKVTCTNI